MNIKEWEYGEGLIPQVLRCVEKQDGISLSKESVELLTQAMQRCFECGTYREKKRIRAVLGL